MSDKVPRLAAALSTAGDRTDSGLLGEIPAKGGETIAPLEGMRQGDLSPFTHCRSLKRGR